MKTAITKRGQKCVVAPVYQTIKRTSIATTVGGLFAPAAPPDYRAPLEFETRTPSMLKRLSHYERTPLNWRQENSDERRA